MKIATWNVNSLRVRLPQVSDWLANNPLEILCLQETKLVDADFPVDEIEALGYRVVYAGQKTYNGVATLSKTTATDIVTDLPGIADPQRRVLGTTIGDFRVLNVYVPNGQSVGSDKYAYKHEWLRRLTDYVKLELTRHRRFVLLGDFNIAPEDADVHDPELWEGRVLFSPPERKAFQTLLDSGLCDTFRKFPQAEKSFTWWDYRGGAFRRNLGLRIDHILASEALCASCVSATIDTAPRKLPRPTDHAPVVAEFLARTRSPVSWGEAGFTVEGETYAGPGHAVFFTVHSDSTTLKRVPGFSTWALQRRLWPRAARSRLILNSVVSTSLSMPISVAAAIPAVWSATVACTPACTNPSCCRCMSRRSRRVSQRPSPKPMSSSPSPRINGASWKMRSISAVFVMHAVCGSGGACGSTKSTPVPIAQTGLSVLRRRQAPKRHALTRSRPA